jgi:hypothetical protein
MNNTRPAHTIEVYKWHLRALNNLYDIEQKLAAHGNPGNAKRNVEQIKEIFVESTQLFYEDPTGKPFSETTADLEASITGIGTENLTVVEVIKPIVRLGNQTFSRVVQKGIVIVKSQSEGKD